MMLLLADALAYLCAIFVLVAFLCSFQLRPTVAPGEWHRFAVGAAIAQMIAIGCAAVSLFIASVLFVVR